MKWHAPQKASGFYSCSSNAINTMTKEDLEAIENQISTIQVSTHGETAGPVLVHGKFKTVEKGRNWGWLLSGFISLNILLLGIAIVSGSVFNKIQISSSHLLIFLILLVILTTVWMVYYKVHTSRVYRAVLYKDSHAGPVWLRAGLVLFGVCSVLMDIFKIIYYVGHMHCDSPVKITFPAVQALFVIVQTYVLWVHAKDCVQLQQNITRCGLMLTLSTNLMVWMMAVTEESLHQTVAPNDISSNSSGSGYSFNITTQGRAEESKCKCIHNMCDIFEKAYYYLYPFNIEYSLFASAMAYVMWKNVGRQIDEHHSHKLRFSPWDVLVGPVAGLIILVAGLATFVVYEVDVAKEDPKKTEEALIMHYVMNIVAIILMSITTLVGCIIFRMDKREQVSEKSPTRSLDVGLLVGSSLGQFLICYFTITAVLASGVKGHINWLNLTCAVLTVIQLCLQNAFLIKGLHREPYKETETSTVFANVMAVRERDPERRSSSIVPAHTLPIPLTLFQGQLPWKRRILKEICAFLLFCNVILWIMPAFGARPQFDNTVGSDIYEFQTWAAVVNIGMPFGIFYRLHSVASLFEVCLAS